MEKLRLSQETGFAVHVISTSSSTSTSHDTLVRPGEGIDNSMGVLYPDTVSPKKGRLACAPCGKLSKMVISAPDSNTYFSEKNLFKSAWRSSVVITTGCDTEVACEHYDSSDYDSYLNATSLPSLSKSLLLI